MRDVENDVNRSNEDFIKHFKTKYDAPPMPQIFVLLSAIKYIVDIISPGNSFKKNLKRLLDDEHQLLTLKEMGFPEDWDLLPVWMW